MAPIDAERLRKAMDLAGVSIAELASAVGVSEEYIVMMRNGQRMATRGEELRRRIADALGVPVDWIEQREQR